jgi:integrase
MHIPTILITGAFNNDMQAVELFLSSIRSPETRLIYNSFFKKFIDFTGDDDLFCGNNSRLIELKIIEYIDQMKKNGKGYSTIHNYIACVLAFYKINDVPLNVTKINKFIPPQIKVKKDRAYSREEIGKLLELADDRVRVMILLMASSGIRAGAIPLLKIRNLEDHKITVYESEREEYFTFISPECKKAINLYLDIRKRYGEELTQNSPLIREKFNTKDPFRVNQPKPLTIAMIKCTLIYLEQRLGMRTGEVAMTHGFRKFFTTQLIHSKVNPEIREMLLGHKIGLTGSYYRPTEEEMYSEYEKAADNLTINEENRLKRRVRTLEIEKSRIDRIELKLQLLEKNHNKSKN